MIDEDDWIPISAVQHYAYCPRQCALIHMEMQWAENRATAEGRLMHEQADSGSVTVRGTVKTVTGLLLRSRMLGLSGKADVVEFHKRDALWLPFPVEYKRGRKKRSDEDRIQLCLQALCLEEMLGLVVERGALFYGSTRRREDVSFTEPLRRKAAMLAKETHILLAGNRLPEAVNDARCPGCSLVNLCLPEQSSRPSAAGVYLESLRSAP